MNDLKQPLNKVNLVLHETTRHGHNDRKILSALYRVMIHTAKSQHLDCARSLERLRLLAEQKYGRRQA